MNAKHLVTFGLAVLMAANVAWAIEPPKMKMTTEVPPGIATPNKLETSLGTLTSVDGVLTRKRLRRFTITSI
jgi:hypothetical protein